MASLHDLLSLDGFTYHTNNNNNDKKLSSCTAVTTTTTSKKNNILSHGDGHRSLFHTLSFCRHRSSVELNRTASADAPEKTGSLLTSADGNAGDEAALRSVVSALSAYAGRFLRDSDFRSLVRERCAACIAAARRPTAAAHAVVANLELGIDCIDRLADATDSSGGGDRRSKSLRNSIRLLAVAAALRSGGFTGGVANAHLSACAHLYLAIVYKIEQDDCKLARHLLEVFYNAPFLARKNLLSDLWEHLFAPHLLHLKVWYNKEVKLVSAWNPDEKEQRIRGLNRVYNDQMDSGTAKFAMYYKEWLKAEGPAPPVPSVPLPSRLSCVDLNRSVMASPVTININLFQAVFGSALERDEGGDVGFLIDSSRLIKEEDDGAEKDDGTEECSCKLDDNVHSDPGSPQKQSNHEQKKVTMESSPPPRRSLSFRYFSCNSEPHKGQCVKPSKIESPTVARESSADTPVTEFDRALVLISSSDNLTECENAIRVVTKAWLDSHGDSSVEKALSTSSVIEGILEIAFTSKDDEVLELSISILAELVARNEVNRQLILHADPQLEIFLRLLRYESVFLKAVVLLHLLQPKAKQMLYLEWIPLVLQTLEHGNQLENLFTLKYSPRLAAFYLLDQLLLGFDEDRNAENAKQMVALGGLGLLVRRMEKGNVHETKLAAKILVACLRADGSCRNYLATNLKKASIVKLLVGNQLQSDGSALLLLSELASLNRSSQIIKFLNGIKNDSCLNTMHVLLVYLQHAPLQHRPLAAAMLLQLDTLGDPLRHSVYRDESIDGLIIALERCLDNKRVQDQCSRALMLLAGRFSSEGKTIAETWLLKRAGLDDGTTESLYIKGMPSNAYVRQEKEEKATEVWLRKLAMVLLTSGNRRLLVALSNCVADGIPSLARSCLVTVAWISNSLSMIKNASNLQSLACSILAPRLLESLSYDRALEERILASLTLLNYARISDCLSRLFPLSKEIVPCLQDLAEVTWTAKELLYLCCR